MEAFQITAKGLTDLMNTKQPEDQSESSKSLGTLGYVAKYRTAKVIKNNQIKYIQKRLPITDDDIAVMTMEQKELYREMKIIKSFNIVG